MALWNLYVRVRLPDRSEGLLLAVYSSGFPDGNTERPPDTFHVLADDYTEVWCLESQLTRVKRVGATVKVNDTAGIRHGMFFEVEEMNLARYRTAVHSGVHSEGRLPPKKDIRESKKPSINRTLRLF